jgi:hypothetical protein
MRSIELASPVAALAIAFSETPPLPIEMAAIARGLRGLEGPVGPPGEPGNAIDIPDLSLIFDNVLSGP